jgi:hypothetical protein
MLKALENQYSVKTKNLDVLKSVLTLDSAWPFFDPLGQTSARVQASPNTGGHSGSGWLLHFSFRLPMLNALMPAAAILARLSGNLDSTRREANKSRRRGSGMRPLCLSPFAPVRYRLSANS